MNVQLIDHVEQIITLAIAFRRYIPLVFTGLIFSMIAAILLIVSMRWVATLITYTLIVVFHALLLLGKCELIHRQPLENKSLPYGNVELLPSIWQPLNRSINLRFVFQLLF